MPANTKLKVQDDAPKHKPAIQMPNTTHSQSQPKDSRISDLLGNVSKSLADKVGTKSKTEIKNNEKLNRIDQVKVETDAAVLQRAKLKERLSSLTASLAKEKAKTAESKLELVQIKKIKADQVKETGAKLKDEIEKLKTSISKSTQSISKIKQHQSEELQKLKTLCKATEEKTAKCECGIAPLKKQLVRLSNSMNGQSRSVNEKVRIIEFLVNKDEKYPVKSEIA